MFPKYRFLKFRSVSDDRKSVESVNESESNSSVDNNIGL